MLGGRSEKANIKLHDVRWVVGSKIEDTYDTLRNGWFGSSKALHIDSYKRIKYVDGYRINLINFVEDKIEKKAIIKKNKAKKIYGLTILEVIIQLLCRRNISLD